MKFGVREICDVVLRAKTQMQVGSKTFYKNEPVLYFDTLTTTSLEGSATTVYAQGGKGNSRLMAWEGERTLTFNMTDALISPESFSILSGASIYDAKDDTNATSAGVKDIFVHTTSRGKVEQVTYGSGSSYWAVKVPGLVCWSHTASISHETESKPAAGSYQPIGKNYWNAGADIFIMKLKDGAISSEPMIPNEANVIEGDANTSHYSIYHYCDAKTKEYYSFIECSEMVQESTVLVDYYIKKEADHGKQIEITPDQFGGYFYLEASTLFRDEATGKDMPAEFIIPNCKIQSNFTFSMSSTGDPSTFDFVLDAFPDYTKFDQTTKVLAVIQIVDDSTGGIEEEASRPHSTFTANPQAEVAAFEHKSSYWFGAAAYTPSPSYGYALKNDPVATTPRYNNSITVPTDIPADPYADS